MRQYVLTILTALALVLTPMVGTAQGGPSYYVVENGQQGGPYPLDVLASRAQQGLITQQTLVWTQGMADWVPAGQVQQLAALWQTTNEVPRLPETTTTQPETNTQPSNNPQLDQLAQQELRDMGVPATNQLHTGAFHGPTPNSIPGGQVVTTKGLTEMLDRNQPFLIFDVLGGDTIIPGAMNAVGAAQAGDFNDQIQQQMGQYLGQVTQNNKQLPVVFYCLSVECWMSYNASLRAINLGYTNVLWYRGGIEAWQAAGFQVMQNGQGQGQGGQSQQSNFN